ncbi:MAG: polysaccharide biosynthesis protein [Clostridia bacterium]|nr:polysaccharide biosynthesis protein [Clostridia bacterium]
MDKTGSRKKSSGARRINTPKLTRIIFLVIADAVSLNLAVFLSLFFRYELDFTKLLTNGSAFVQNAVKFAPFYTVIGIVIFAVFKLYTSLWEYASLDEAIRIVAACAVVDVISFVIMKLFAMKMPMSFHFLNGILLAVLILLIRFSYRLLRRNWRHTSRGAKRTLLIGAGRSGMMTLTDIQANKESDNRVVRIIDDDESKWGQYLLGVKIIGGRDKIVETAKKLNIEEIIIAIPSATNLQRREIIEICRETNCKLRILPSILQLANGEVSVSRLRDVQIEDLLGRDSVKVDLSDIMSYVSNSVILVTGGGGSIGSELCRQIASHAPETLIIFDIYENNAYEIQMELMRKYPTLDLVVLIGSVRDRERLDAVFEQYRPQYVFHAAAHKHVPLMETSPNEAIKNNVFGTLNVARAADKYSAKRMLLISTDKAVNPTNVMGASKRICEMIVQTMNNHSETEYVAVRFGNVLGSNGSVIPLFRKQIEQGGPVTVTHKDIIRYFMTIPEAVSLVLQAGAYAKGGEIFVLDMGKPVRIDDLARNMIRLSGYEPDVDIHISYTGLRPGEKLFEELLMDEEGMVKTDNQLIYIGHPIEVNEQEFVAQLKKLQELCEKNSPQIREMVKRIVKGYHEPKQGK